MGVLLCEENSAPPPPPPPPAMDDGTAAAIPLPPPPPAVVSGVVASKARPTSKSWYTGWLECSINVAQPKPLPSKMRGELDQRSRCGGLHSNSGL